MTQSIDEYKSDWLKTFLERGHEPQMTNEDDQDGPPVVDWFADYRDIHNGLVCVKCHWSTCLWCSHYDKIPVCTAVEDGKID